MSIRVLGSLLFFVSGLTACATSYQSRGFSGGFRDSQLAPDVFQVSFHGNGFTSADRVNDFALLRAADVCLAHGFQYFVLINSADQSRTITRYQPATAQTTGVVTDSGQFSSTTTYEPAVAHHIHKPGVGITVQGLVDKPAGRFAYNAAMVDRSIKDTYDIK